ncbi:hypothetical protein GCM10009789_39900 [Kribbella sancticallisti]|uniref:Glyoxalase-like domain-containing protein n=1 Tax=Kribbella sancticallisti TaxID=460087 RepID=A0ABP4PQ73_9ACTN
MLQLDHIAFGSQDVAAVRADRHLAALRRDEPLIGAVPVGEWFIPGVAVLALLGGPSASR